MPMKSFGPKTKFLWNLMRIFRVMINNYSHKLRLNFCHINTVNTRKNLACSFFGLKNGPQNYVVKYVP